MTDKKLPTEQRDQLTAFLNTKLDEFITMSRELRAKRQEQFGYIDQFRLNRDLASGLMQGLDHQQQSLLLAAALDRLGRMDDFNPVADLADLDFEPEIPEEEQK